MKRQQIIDKLKEILSQILIVNGYQTNIGQNVFDWRLEPLRREETPCIVIRDIESYVEEDYTDNANDIRLELQFDIIMTTTIEDLRKALADLKKCLGQNETLDGLVFYMQWKNDSFDADLEEDRILVASCRVSTLYRVNRWGI